MLQCQHSVQCHCNATRLARLSSFISHRYLVYLIYLGLQIEATAVVAITSFTHTPVMLPTSSAKDKPVNPHQSATAICSVSSSPRFYSVCSGLYCATDLFVPSVLCSSLLCSTLFLLATLFSLCLLFYATCVTARSPFRSSGSPVASASTS